MYVSSVGMKSGEPNSSPHEVGAEQPPVSVAA